MLLEIIPCTHAVKCQEHQLFYKLAEELKEVQQAAIDLETGIRDCVTFGARKVLHEHLDEKIVDLITAAVTLGELYAVDWEQATKMVKKKNTERRYYE